MFLTHCSFHITVIRSVKLCLLPAGCCTMKQGPRQPCVLLRHSAAEVITLIMYLTDCVNEVLQESQLHCQTYGSAFNTKELEIKSWKG